MSTDKDFTDKEKRSEQILDSAEELIRKSGFQSVTMDEIASASDVSKGTVYLYFKNKQDLFLALHNRSLNMLVNRCAEVLSENLPGIQLLRRVGETFLRFNQENAFYMEIFLKYESLLLDEENLQNDHGKECNHNAQRIFSYITRCIQIGLSDGSIATDRDPKELAVMLWGAGRGLTQLSYLQNNRVIDTMMGDVDISMGNLFMAHLDLILESISSKRESAKLVS